MVVGGRRVRGGEEERGLVGPGEGLRGEEHGHLEDEDFLGFVFLGGVAGVQGGRPLELHAFGEADRVVLVKGGGVGGGRGGGGMSERGKRVSKERVSKKM